MVQIAAILQLCAFGTATSYARTVIPSSTPTATPTPVPLGGSASGFNGVTGDCNENALVSIDELVRGVNIALERQALENCPAFDANGNGRVTVDELVLAVGIALRGAPPTFTPTQIPSGDLVTLVSSSPANGEGGVAVTRETVLRFDGPVDPSSVTSASIMPTYGGGGLFARLHVSPDARTVTLFYEVFLPASSRVRVTVDGGRLRGTNGMAVDANGDGQPGGVAIIDFDTLNLTTLPGTAVCGRVFASHLVSGANGTSMNVPLPGVTIEVDGAAGELNAVTDQFGNFRLEPAPVGRFFVFIRGTTATVGVPLGAYYPDVGKAWEAVAGVETTIGDIFLPLIEAGTLQPVSATSDTVIRFPESVRQEFPELAGVQLTVPADSLFDRTGTRGGMVGIAPVAPDRIPSRLPPGLDFPLVITVQTDGGENFDRPVPVCFPNLPDRTTGQPLAPGAASALWSFNHDTGEFEIVGPMRVTADGRLVCTEPGVGIIAPGWHGTAPGAGGSGGPIGGPGSDDDQESGGGDPPGRPSRPRCGGQQGSGGDNVVDPAYLFSGELYEEVDDLRIPGRGVDFVWSRKYRSKIGPNTIQGNGWDFSYNISLIPDGADLVVCDGNSRRDTYGLSPVRSAAAGAASGASVFIPGGIWTRREQFNELTQNADGTFTFTFPDGGTWLFNPIDGTPAQGKLRASTDRNGNSLGFAYDGFGRLATITDTLDRVITVAYNAGGFIDSVTDFIGRQVRYQYYQDGDADGSFGDLKSVRSPIVTGTPNGNDFLDGKLTTYTYTTGFADDRLNHNLLTITDGRRNDPNDATFGQGPYVVNVYADTEDPDDVDFDRLVRQLWGGPTDIVDLVYVPQTPSAANGQAYMKAIVNDRVGNVKEYVFERGNRVVIRREYTGRADADRPTTETSNRPKNKLRPDDPDVFETRYEWNDDSLMTRVVHPNGNSMESTYELDLDPNASARARGNLRRMRHLPGRLAPVSDQAEIIEELEYDERFGCGSCGGQFVTRHVDGRGNDVQHEYDERGNRIRTVHRVKSAVEEWEYNQFGQVTASVLPDNGSGQRRRDAYAYHDSGPQHGYLRERVTDAGGTALTQQFEYDSVGNLIRVIDARGHDTQFVVNPLNQRTRAVSQEVQDGTGVRYARDLFYDANNNLVRVDTQNVDEAGQPRANAGFTSTFEYELLNRLVRRTDEVDASTEIVTEFEHDANRNQILTRYGEATSGGQPANVRRVAYDERDLVFREIGGAGTAEQSTLQFDYDGNRNRIAMRQGIESEPRVLSGVRDGYDRLVRITDAMGAVQTRTYDANGNRVRVRLEGELDDIPGSANNVRLTETTYTFDPMNRTTVEEEAYFDLQTQTPAGDGMVTKRAVFSDNSQLLRVIDDNGNERRLDYDSANRMRSVTDPKNNGVAYQYDAGSNIVTITETDRSDLGTPAEQFTTRLTYDNLNRVVQVVDNAGNTQRLGHDSRGHQVHVIDAKGNVTRQTYDGLARLVETARVLTDSGDGSGTPVDDITTTFDWDDSSRLLRALDANGNATTYTYDALNRTTAINRADGTRQVSTFDVHGNVVTLADANGTVVQQTFDLLDRLVERSVQRAPGILGTTFERYGYDGRSRLVRGEDDDSLLARQYDSLSHTVGETLNGETTRSRWDGEDNQIEIIYPGGRRLQNTFDGLDRKRTIADDGGTLATYAFIGPRRVQERTYGNGTRTRYTYDGVRRMTASVHELMDGAGTSIFDERTYAWDPAFNKTEHRSLTPSELARQYRYDSVQRLTQSIIDSAAGRTETTYVLDAVDNRLRVEGGAGAGDYVLSSSAPDPADSQMNQYSRTPFDARQYDANGTLRSIDVLPLGGTAEIQIAYDFRDQMVEHRNVTRGVTTTYAYDVLGRRSQKVVDDGTPETTRFFYDRWREIEEQDAQGNTIATYVYGHYIDDLLGMHRGGTDFFYHADDLYAVRALTDATGAVVERYDYGDFGAPTVLDPNGAPRAGSAFGNPHLFNGRRFDPESGFYQFRARYLDPLTGRYTTRDPIGPWGDFGNRGNAFAFVGNNPLNRLDPSGLMVQAPPPACAGAGGAGAPGGNEGETGGLDITDEDDAVQDTEQETVLDGEPEDDTQVDEEPVGDTDLQPDDDADTDVDEGDPTAEELPDDAADLDRWLENHEPFQPHEPIIYIFLGPPLGFGFCFGPVIAVVAAGALAGCAADAIFDDDDVPGGGDAFDDAGPGGNPGGGPDDGQSREPDGDGTTGDHDPANPGDDGDDGGQCVGAPGPFPGGPSGGGGAPRRPRGPRPRPNPSGGGGDEPSNPQPPGCSFGPVGPGLGRGLVGGGGAP